jgi:hypothetical protein
MRTKVVIPLIFTALIAVFLPLLLRHRKQTDISVPMISTKTINVADEKLSHHPSNVGLPKKPARPEVEIAAGAATGPDEEDYVEQRVSELRDLSMTDDPDSLATITSELDSREPQIRRAALAATIQFGSRDAIPALQNALPHAGDPQEKVDLQKAIDFLALPSMAEIANRNN